jgi:hypothetical protein
MSNDAKAANLAGLPPKWRRCKLQKSETRGQHLEPLPVGTMIHDGAHSTGSTAQAFALPRLWRSSPVESSRCKYWFTESSMRVFCSHCLAVLNSPPCRFGWTKPAFLPPSRTLLAHREWREGGGGAARREGAPHRAAPHGRERPHLRKTASAHTSCVCERSSYSLDAC